MKNKLILALIVLIVLAAAGFLVLFNPTHTGEEVPDVEVTQVTPTPITDENDALAKAVKAQIVAEHGQVASTLKITVNKIQGDFAQGAANDPDARGGGQWFAAKVNGEWKLVYDGNGMITCDQLEDYPEFPADLIPACFDKASEQMQNR